MAQQTTSTKKPVKKSSDQKVKTVKNSAKKAEKTPSLVLDNTTFELRIPATTVQTAWQKALEQTSKRIKQDGFRQGNVPTKLAEKVADPSYLLEKTLEAVFPAAYEAYLTEHKLQPLTEPEIKPLSMKTNEEWILEVTIAQSPEVSIDKYEDVVAQVKKTHEAWKDTPVKANKAQDSAEDKKVSSPEESEQQVRGQRLNAILTALLEKYRVGVPELLLRRETENQLHELEHQLEHMNLTLKDFLEKTHKKLEDIQNDYAARSLGILQVELLLSAIIRTSNIEVSEQEIAAALKQRLEQYPPDSKPQITSRDVTHVHSLILKQKALDHLLSL
jgi:FKBP-type peptidyl-prolyl cis-trans isomerase (trigger factor)